MSLSIHQFFVLCWILGSSLVASFVFPEPDGPFKVKLDTFELVDKHRIDPYNSTHSRRLMISRFDPVPKRSCTKTCQVPYMPPKTAKYSDDLFVSWGASPDEFSRMRLQLCCTQRDHPHKKSTAPPLIFSHGLGLSRLHYSAIAQRVASQGYTVLTIDHPYDADMVEFPDGTVIRGLPFTDVNQFPAAVEVRAADMQFVLDTLNIPKTGRGRNMRVGTFGHSMGGETSILTMSRDLRIAGAINFDGNINSGNTTRGFGSSKVPQAFLLMGVPGHNSTVEPSWAKLWDSQNKPPHNSVWKKELSLARSKHLTFMDFPAIADLGGFRESVPQVNDDMLGYLDGLRVLEIVSAYVVDFFDFTLKRRGEGLLRRPSKHFPEVTFLRK